MNFEHTPKLHWWVLFEIWAWGRRKRPKKKIHLLCEGQRWERAVEERVLEGLYRKTCRLTRVYGFPNFTKIQFFPYLKNPMGLVWGKPNIWTLPSKIFGVIYGLDTFVICFYKEGNSLYLFTLYHYNLKKI